MPVEQLEKLVLKFVTKDVLLSRQLDYPVYNFVVHDCRECFARLPACASARYAHMVSTMKRAYLAQTALKSTDASSSVSAAVRSNSSGNHHKTEIQTRTSQTQVLTGDAKGSERKHTADPMLPETTASTSATTTAATTTTTAVSHNDQKETGAITIISTGRDKDKERDKDKAITSVASILDPRSSLHFWVFDQCVYNSASIKNIDQEMDEPRLPIDLKARETKSKAKPEPNLNSNGERQSIVPSIFSDDAQHSNKKTRRARDAPRSDKPGPGVFFDSIRGRWIGYVGTGKNQRKTFSVNKYGEEQARQMALQFRKEQTKDRDALLSAST
jgi:hypothetical protein